MKILHLIHRYYPERGGAEQHMRVLSNYLAAQGHDVTVVTSDAGAFERFWNPSARSIDEREAMDGLVKVRRFPIRHLPISRLAFPALRRLQYVKSRAPLVPLAVLNRLSKLTPRLPALWEWANTTGERFDVVAGMTITLEGFPMAGLALARRLGVPFVCYPLAHLGAGALPGQDSLSRFYTLPQQNATVTQADFLMAQTEAERNYYVGKGLARSKAVLAGPGVNLEDGEQGRGNRFREKFGIDGKIVLSVGQLSAEKGTTTTVAAAQHLWQNGHRFDLVLIGEATPEVEKMVAGLKSAERQHVHLLGRAPDATKWDALAAASVFAMPSRTDSFGIAYLEAWLYRTPVIAANTWGVTDLVKHEVDGLIIHFGAVSAMADAIGRLLSDDAFSQTLGENGYAKVQGHSWEKKCEIVEAAYLRLVGEDPT